MRRSLSTFFAAFTVPAVGLFVLTAHPARLYAEAAPAPPACTAPEVTTCAAQEAGAACSWDGGSGVCQAGLCANADSGTNVNTMRCGLPPACASAQQLADCVGKSVGQSCGTGGFCGVLQCAAPDGGTEPTLACLYMGAEPPPEAGPEGGGDASPDALPGDAAADAAGETATTGSADSTCSCDVVGRPSSDAASAIGASAALLVAIGALLRQRRARGGGGIS